MNLISECTSLNVKDFILKMTVKNSKYVTKITNIFLILIMILENYNFIITIKNCNFISFVKNFNFITNLIYYYFIIIINLIFINLNYLTKMFIIKTIIFTIIVNSNLSAFIRLYSTIKLMVKLLFKFHFKQIINLSMIEFIMID